MENPRYCFAIITGIVDLHARGLCNGSPHCCSRTSCVIYVAISGMPHWLLHQLLWCHCLPLCGLLRRGKREKYKDVAAQATSNRRQLSDGLEFHSSDRRLEVDYRVSPGFRPQRHKGNPNNGLFIPLNNTVIWYLAIMPIIQL